MSEGVAVSLKLVCAVPPLVYLTRQLRPRIVAETQVVVLAPTVAETTTRVKFPSEVSSLSSISNPLAAEAWSARTPACTNVVPSILASFHAPVKTPFAPSAVVVTTEPARRSVSCPLDRFSCACTAGGVPQSATSNPTRSGTKFRTNIRRTESPRRPRPRRDYCVPYIWAFTDEAFVATPRTPEANLTPPKISTILLLAGSENPFTYTTGVPWLSLMEKVCAELVRLLT